MEKDRKERIKVEILAATFSVCWKYYSFSTCDRTFEALKSSHCYVK